MTAATFQHALERDLTPKQASYFGATFLSDVQGASGYKGLPAHVSGIKVTGDQLAITLTQKDAGFLSKVATPFACAIPKATPSTPRASSRSPAPARTTSRAGHSTARSC